MVLFKLHANNNASYNAGEATNLQTVEQYFKSF